MSDAHDELIASVRSFVEGGGRLLGLAGPPGAGKSTTAARIVDTWGLTACVLPMDGFHLADEELTRLGRAGRKGAPDTFDVDGYVAALERVARREADVLVPRFVRAIEEPIANAIRIAVDAELVVTEGNYLLLDQEPWHRVRPLLDACWYLDLDDETRIERLVARHVHHGRTPDEATRWVAEVDERNTEVIVARRSGADRVVAID